MENGGCCGVELKTLRKREGKGGERHKWASGGVRKRAGEGQLQRAYKPQGGCSVGGRGQLKKGSGGVTNQGKGVWVGWHSGGVVENEEAEEARAN